jgi:hypothetical protein
MNNVKVFQIRNAVEIDGLIFQALVHGRGFESSNKKEGAAWALTRGLAWVETTIYPAEMRSGEGSVIEAEAKACDKRCAFSAIGRREGSGAPKCYVAGKYLPQWHAKAKSQLTDPNAIVSLIEGRFILRLTRWGDLSRLSDEGLRYVIGLASKAAETRAYSNIWRSEMDAIGTPRWALIQEVKAFTQASVSTPQEALQAARLGWKVYAGLRQDETREALISAGFGPVYRCPYVEGGRITCSICPMPCNGQKHILSPRQST